MTQKTAKEKVLEHIVLSDPRVSAARARLAAKGFSEEASAELSLRYLSAMKSRINPTISSIVSAVAQFGVQLSFSKVHVKGLEEIVDILKIGSVALVSSHFSYADVGILPAIFANSHIGNVFYEGGENVVSIPVVRPVADSFLRNFGLVPIKREIDVIKEKEKAPLYVAVLQAYVSQLLQQKNNVLNFAGRGRHRTGELQPVHLAVSSSIIQDAKYVVPVAITYTRVPEAAKFVAAWNENQRGQQKGQPNGRKGKQKSRTISEAFGLIRPDGYYGDVYVVFGQSIPTHLYASQVSQGDANDNDNAQVEKTLHFDLTAAVKELITLTPTSALAVTLLRLSESGQNSVQLGNLITSVSWLVTEAKASGVLIPPYLLEGYGKPVLEAINYMRQHGALELTKQGRVKVHNDRLLKFYAGNIMPTLQHFAQRAASQA